MQVLIFFLIRIYQKIISPMKGSTCRFIPSCSEYAFLAVKKYGTVKGVRLSLKRIARCHPWHRGGYDPVP